MLSKNAIAPAIPGCASAEELRAIEAVAAQACASVPMAALLTELGVDYEDGVGHAAFYGAGNDFCRYSPGNAARQAFGASRSPEWPIWHKDLMRIRAERSSELLSCGVEQPPPRPDDVPRRGDRR